MADTTVIPQGFVLDQPDMQQGSSALPSGFQLDAPVVDQAETARASLPGRFVEGVGEFATGVGRGVERVGVGLIQAAADVSSALGSDLPVTKRVLSAIRPDLQEEIESLTAEDISTIIGQREARRVQREEDRGIAFQAGRIAGEVAPFLPVGAGLGAIKGGALGGAAVGAATPTEEGGLAERVEQTAISGALGAGLGAGLRGLGAAAKGVRGFADRLARASNPEEVLARRLPDEQTEQLLTQLKESGEDVILPDVAGEEIKGLTRSVAKFSGGPKDLITDALEGRAKKAVERVSNRLAKDISDVETFFGSLDDLVKSRSAIAAPEYQKAFAKGTTLDISKNKELFDKIAPDLQTARTKFRLDPSIPNNSIIMLDAAKKSLDDKISKALRQGERQEAKVLGDIKKELVTKLDALNPNYRKARKVFSDFTAVKTAQEEGLKALTRTPEEISRAFKELSVAEKDAYRIGFREALQRVVSKTSEGRDPANRIFGNSFTRNQIRAVFDDEARFKSFEKKMREEIAGFDTLAKVLKGSRTDINQATDAEIIGGAITVARTALGDKQAILGALTNSIKNRAAGLNDRNAREIAGILVDRTKGIEALERILAKEKGGTQKRIIGELIEFLRPELLGARAITEQRRGEDAI